MNTRERTRVLDWNAQIDLLSYEQILGIPADASPEVARRAYLQFAQCFHPDMHPDADRDVHEALCRLFQRGSEAYRVLTDPSLRARWSKSRQAGALRLSDLAPTPTVNLRSELPNLHIQCRSGGAKLEARKAAVAFARGDMAGTSRHLENAMAFEGGASLDLARCLEAIKESGTIG